MRIIAILLILAVIVLLVGGISYYTYRREEAERDRQRWEDFQFDIKRDTSVWYDHGTGRYYRRHR